MKKTGKLLTVLLLGMLISTPVHAAENPDVWCETDVEDGNLTASIETNGEVTDGVVSIGYDSSKVSCTEDDVEIADSVEMYSVNVTEGSVKISFLAEEPIDAGTLAEITFEVVDEDADPETAITSFVGNAYDAEGEPVVVKTLVPVTVEESTVKINPESLNLGDIWDKYKKDPGEDYVEVIISQTEPSEKKDQLKAAIEKEGYIFVASFDINMEVRCNGDHLTYVTEDFGEITLSLPAKDYKGKDAIVYQIHGDEILSYKGLSVNSEGYVNVSVDKLSAFAVAVKKSEPSQTNPPTNPPTTPPDENPEEDNGLQNVVETGGDTVQGAPTGDSTVILPYLILMLVSGGLLVAFAMKKRPAAGTGKKSDY